jgi:thiamine biosynthesis protein ThiI
MGKGVVLMSGGIDSPVAADMLLSQGEELVAVHLDNRPFTDDTPLEKVRDHLRVLETRHGRSLPLYLLPHGSTQITLMRNTDRHVGCVLCRRFMWRGAEQVASREGASYLVTGEALGQVASQTLSNMRSATSAVTLPIIRPLVGFDKQEIEARAKALGTYGISTRPGLCCQAVPDKPATRTRLVQILEEESRVDVGRMLEDVARHAQVL